MKRRTELSYRIAAIDGSDPIGLLLALYDTLSGNLRRASAAQRAGNIELRCAELNHAYMVLGQLESWVDPDRDKKLADSLAMFYAFLRDRMFSASLSQSAMEFDALVEMVSQVRTTWQQRATSLALELSQSGSSEAQLLRGHGAAQAHVSLSRTA